MNNFKDLSTLEIINILSSDISQIECIPKEILEKVYEDFSNNKSYSEIIRRIAIILGIEVEDNIEKLLAEKMKNDEKAKKSSFKPR